MNHEAGMNEARSNRQLNKKPPPMKNDAANLKVRMISMKNDAPNTKTMQTPMKMKLKNLTLKFVFSGVPKFEKYWNSRIIFATACGTQEVLPLDVTCQHAGAGHHRGSS